MAVGAGAAMARHMLDHTGNAARGEPVQHCPAERGDLHWLGPEGAVADDRVCAGMEQVEHRRGIDVDPDFGEDRAPAPAR